MNKPPCFSTHFNVSSKGIWENIKSPSIVFKNSLPLLETQTALIFAFSQASHAFLRCIGIHEFVSQMMAGLILGPQLIDLMGFSAKKLSSEWFFDGNAPLNCIGGVGFMLFVFLMAVKTNTRMVFNSGKLPVMIGLASVLVPLVVGMSVRNIFVENLNPNYMEPKKALGERSVVVAFQSLTMLPVITNLLTELKILNSELGRLALSSTIISDFFGTLLVVFLAFYGVYKEISVSMAFKDLTGIIFYVVLVFFVLKPTAEWIVRYTPEGKPVSDFHVCAVLILVLASGLYTNFFNQYFVLGPLLFGLAVPDGPPLGSTFEFKIEKLVKNMFLPVFVTVSTMKADLMGIVYEFDDICYNMFLVFLTLVAKMAASLVPCLCCKIPLRDAIALALIMNCKGFVELFLYNAAKDKKNLTHATYTFVVFYILLNAGIVPTVVKTLYDPKRKYAGFQKRNIMHLKSDAELRILTCLHRPENVSSMISVLKTLTSRRESPMSVYVLHLVKLVGRAFPVLISHQKRTKRVLDSSFFETAMLAFNRFELDNWGLASVSSFTAFSPEDLMHEDICTLALDHVTSMIVLPFHRKWLANGAFESDDAEIRHLNRSLLERAPCSIAILIDRGQLSRSRQNPRNNNNLKPKGSVLSDLSLRIGVLFVGGKDDREALTLAQRMAKNNPQISLTVVRFAHDQESKFTNWEYILDHEALKDLKQSHVRGQNVAYFEKLVGDWMQLVSAVRSAANDFDLLIVGRHFGLADSLEVSGLSEWTEFPELGVIGDLLTAKDLDTRVCVLVVQQQQQL